MSLATIKKIKDFFACPVCRHHIVTLHIYQCLMGHIFCDSCNKLVSTCPVCGEEKSGRARLMERIRSEFPEFLFFCEYNDNGCEFVGKANVVDVHQITCQFGGTLCPFSLQFSCKWQGRKKDVGDHFKEEHPEPPNAGSVPEYQTDSIKEVATEESAAPVPLDDTLKRLADLLECPVCLNYMVAVSIFQCVMGHVICEKCNSSTVSCPVCRGEKSGRVAILEEISTDLEFPCENSYKGCDFSSKGEELKKHQITCNFSDHKCPLSFADTPCRWVGCVKDMVDHFKENHPEKLYFGSSILLKISGVLESTVQRSAALVYAFNTVFTIKWEFNKFLEDVRVICVSSYPVPEEEVSFNYSVRILNGSDVNNYLRTAISKVHDCTCLCTSPSYSLYTNKKRLWAYLSRQTDINFLINLSRK